MGLRILIRCDAHNQVGFGHLSRCLQIIDDLKRQCEEELIFFLWGDFSSKAIEVVNKRLHDVNFLGGTNYNSLYFDLGIVDTMFDTYDMEYYSIAELASVRAQCDKVLLIASSITIPDQLPVDCVVGHMIESQENKIYQILSGLQYAPVEKSVLAYREPEVACNFDVKKVFVAIGSWKDPDSLFSILNGLNEAQYELHVEVLLSLAHQDYLPVLRKYEKEINIKFLQNVPSVFPYLREADIVICSYGNLLFEAMSLGRPCAVVGLKKFQTLYSEILAEKELIYFIGDSKKLSTYAINKMLNILNWDYRKKLSNNGIEKIDGLGIQRISNILKHLIKETSPTIF